MYDCIIYNNSVCISETLSCMPKTNRTLKLTLLVKKTKPVPPFSLHLTMDRGSWPCTGDRDQDHLHGKEMQKRKMAVWVGLTNSCEKKRSEKQRRKGKIQAPECIVSKNSKKR